MRDKVKNADRRTLILLGVISIALIALFLVVGLNPKSYEYALSRRIPKIYTVVLTGGCIGFSTLIFQTVTNNQILTPSILGLDSLYGLLNTVLVFFLGSTSPILINDNTNFLVTLAVMLGVSTVFYILIFKKKSQNIFFLLLVGVVVGTLFDSFSTFLGVLIDPSEFLVIQDKSQATFNNINTGVLALATGTVILTALYSLKFVNQLDVMALGRDQAINLGVDYDNLVKKMLIVVVILTAVATALVGPITFLGLLVVNIARYLVKSYKHKVQFLATVLISTVFLVGALFVVERLLSFSTSVGVIINFVGGIYFIYLLLKGRTQ